MCSTDIRNYKEKKPMPDKENKTGDDKKKQGEGGKITKTTEDGKGADFKGPGIEGEKGADEENAVLKGEIARLNEENTNLQTDASRLKEENASLLTDTSKLKADKTALETKNSKLEDENSKLQKKKPEEKKAEEPKEEKKHVTIEDILPTLRKKGYKI